MYVPCDRSVVVKIFLVSLCTGTQWLEKSVAGVEEKDMCVAWSQIEGSDSYWLCQKNLVLAQLVLY